MNLAIWTPAGGFADDAVSLTERERAQLTDALAVADQRDSRLHRLLGGVAVARGWRASDVSISWTDGGPVVRHRRLR